MKRKSNHKKNKNEKEIKDITKEVGVFDDFLVIDKIDNKKGTENKKKNVKYIKEWLKVPLLY